MSRKIKERQTQAIALLSGGVSCTSVAASLKVTRETISRWKNEPHFRAELNAATEDARETLRSRLLGMAEKALQVIEADLSADQPSDKRSRTAIKILELAANGKIGLPEEPLITDQCTLQAIKREEKSKQGWIF
ncbi:MAG: hypothetical protein EB059_00165 [Alphaproteobacteria bacterium]|nr:hypothetical protein [Alphaproteobacteria bacterium]